MKTNQFEPYLNCLPLHHQGKVRDTFSGTLTPGTLLVVATDRISTHDIVHKSMVPGKGELLTALTIFWSQEVLSGLPNHIVAFGKDIYDHLPNDRVYPEDLHLRALIIRKLDMIPFELIFRARMAGSLWDKFYKKGIPNPYGIELEGHLRLMSELNPVAFTPTDKSETDDPVVAVDIERQYFYEVELAARAYRLGREYAKGRGIDIIDAKFEVGTDEQGRCILADEWLTGDCARFVLEEDIVIGENPPWADKQIFRDDAIAQWAQRDSKNPLVFSENVIEEGLQAYHDVFEIFSGYTLGAFQDQHLS